MKLVCNRHWRMPYRSIFRRPIDFFFLEEATGSTEVLETVGSLKRCRKDRGEVCVLEGKGVVRTAILPQTVLNRTVDLRVLILFSD